MLKITPLFGIVLAIHAVVIGVLILQPGCQTNTTDTPEPEASPLMGREDPPREEDALTTTVRPAPRDAISAPATLDDAFNAGFSTSQPGETAASSTDSSRQVPQRPGRIPTEGFSRDPFPQEAGQRIPVEDDGPRYASYTVQSGDSLWKIAQQHDIALSTLLEANQMSRNSVIHAGQSLQIPLEAPELEPMPTEDRALSSGDVDVATTRYTVQRGDNLTRIAERFSTTVEELKKLNQKRDDVIRVGENLVVPGSGGVPQTRRQESPAPREGEASPPRETSSHTHTVVAGENPTMIAQKYGMTTRDLIRLNDNLDPRRLHVGQVLKIEPAPGMAPAARPEAERDRPQPTPETHEREPVRIQASERQPEPEPEPDFDPSIFFDDVEEIPVQRIENNG